MHQRAFKNSALTGRDLSVPVYGVGAGAVDPPGTGDGASVEPSVLGGFLRAAPPVVL